MDIFVPVILSVIIGIFFISSCYRGDKVDPRIVQTFFYVLCFLFFIVLPILCPPALILVMLVVIFLTFIAIDTANIDKNAGRNRTSRKAAHIEIDNRNYHIIENGRRIKKAAGTRIVLGHQLEQPKIIIKRVLQHGQFSNSIRKVARASRALSKDDRCPYCWENLVNQVAVETPCGHFFCVVCMDKIASFNTKALGWPKCIPCPVCRGRLPVSPEGEGS